MLELGFDEAVFDRLGNVIGTIPRQRPGKTILMDGHIDTVDVIDEAQWTHGPFSGEIADGKIYGRGASDMKGSDCAMVMAAGRFAAQTKKNFAGTICVSGTVHEECFEGVAPREVTKRVKPDFVIVGEATSTSIKIGQRGRAEVVVETEGVSCHSSNPEKGVNAVYGMMAVIEEIRKIVPNEHPLLGRGILELTDIGLRALPGASVVPAACRATFDRRTLVGEDEAVILGQVEEAIARARKSTRKSKRAVIWRPERKPAGPAIRFRQSGISRHGWWTKTPNWSSRRGGGWRLLASMRRCRISRSAPTAAISCGEAAPHDRLRSVAGKPGARARRVH